MPDERWESTVREAARAFVYPETPDIAEAVRRSRVTLERPIRPRARLRWAVGAGLALLLVAVGLASVPQVRASVLALLQIGGIRILAVEPTAPAPVVSQPSEIPQAPPPGPLTSVLELAGETTLAKAEVEVGFDVRLPTYPPDLGPPERVYRQDFDGPLVVLVWLDSDPRERARLSLHQLGPGVLGEKGPPPVVQEATVNGRPAVWTEGPYLLQFLDENGVAIFDSRRLVSGHVLVWEEDEITYRLETELSLEEAVRIAESVE